MADISEWSGINNINWGKSYSESEWGNVNELNSWGIIYPFNAEGSTVTGDSLLFSADDSDITVDNGTSTPAVAFTCSNAGFLISNGTTGNTISIVSDATVSQGTITSISPSTYQSGNTTYTAVITVPFGYTNTGASISNCTNNATGTSFSLPTSPGTLVTTRQQILSSFDGTAINYVYNSVTYPGGFTDTLSVLRNLDGVTINTGLGSNFVQFDAVSPIVGSYVADGFGNFLSSSNMGNFGQYAAFSTPKYMRFAANVPLGSAGGFTNPFNAFPIYKVEQANGFIQITQIITS
tara:strand:+ start:5805 stop:6683 length:879 start_codon:yes stop_codon:yes gene_type:complete